jgi:death-on-curing protein
VQKISITPVDAPTFKKIQPGKYAVMKNSILFCYSVGMHKFMTILIPGAPVLGPASARLRRMEKWICVDLNQKALESALAQPKMALEGKELYPSLAEKATALCYSLINNHPFAGGNKRIVHAAMEVFLVMNGYEIEAAINEQEEIMLKLASSKTERLDFFDWIKDNIIKIK